MLFNSLTFVVFFAIVLALHNLPLPWKTKKVNLLIASYVFYAAWNPPFVLLLWLSTMVDWWVARRIYDTDRQSRRRALLGISLAVNLGMLGYFKYGGFLLENWAALMSTIGVTWTAPGWDIVLPVGISFYTFQTLAYSLDVYLRRAKPADSSARVWQVQSSPIPFSARSIIASTSARGTASPSAVPWISTIPPRAVATTFRSTRAVLSSW